jgi:transcriptional regulator with XRE-family HTH domain
MNPLRQRARNLGLTDRAAAQRAGVDQSLLSLIFNAKASLTVPVAQALAGPLQSDHLSLIVANALWKQNEKLKVNATENAFISASEIISGLPAAKLHELAAANLHYLENLLTQPNAAPSVIMKDNKSPSLILTDNKQEDDAIPPAPAVILKGAK